MSRKKGKGTWVATKEIRCLGSAEGLRDMRLLARSGAKRASGMNDASRLYVVVRGALHPFDAPTHPAVQIVGWEHASSAEDAASAVAGRDKQHDYYTAAEWHGAEWKTVLYVPEEGVDCNPPDVLIG